MDVKLNCCFITHSKTNDIYYCHRNSDGTKYQTYGNIIKGDCINCVYFKSNDEYYKSKFTNAPYQKGTRYAVFNLDDAKGSY